MILDDVPELLHPHRPPDDPQWPPPRDPAELFMRVMNRLAPRLRLWCAAVAVAMAEPVWLNWCADRQRPNADAELLGAARRRFEQLLRGQRTEADWQHGLRLPTDPLVIAELHEELAPAAHDSARFALQALTVLLAPEPRRSQTAGFAVWHACTAVVQTRCAPGTIQPALRNYFGADARPLRLIEAFLQAWWDRCRCRLAFADVLGADFS